MKSFSDLLPRPAAASSLPSFASWTPEALHTGAAGDSGDAALEAAIRGRVAEEVEAALQQQEEALREVAERERREAEKAAYDRGFEEGRQAGELGEAARLRTAVAAAEEALDELRAGEVRWAGTIEENICALAVVVARQVLGRELAADITPVADLVRAALAEFQIDQPMRIRINPSDLTRLSSAAAGADDPLAAITGEREARWHPDASIAPGGCLVEGRERIIDGRVDTALERIYRRLTYTNA